MKRAATEITADVVLLGETMAVLASEQVPPRHTPLHHSGRSRDRDGSTYAAAKGGLKAMTRQPAVGLAPRTRANAISLGGIFTAVWHTATEDELTAICARIPLNRIGSQRRSRPWSNSSVRLRGTCASGPFVVHDVE